MEIKIIVPNMGESIVDATVSRWLKKIGEDVAAGDPLVELETNKANIDVPAEQNGILASIEKQDGEDVKVGEILGTIAPAQGEPDGKAVPASGEETDLAAAINESLSSQMNEAKTEEIVTPVARRMAQEHHLDPARIEGSGAKGRVLKADVERFLVESGGGGSPLPPDSPSIKKEAPEIPGGSLPPLYPIPSPSLSTGSREEHVKLSRKRRTIAQKLVEAQHTAAMLTTFNDVDMSAVMALRKARNPAFQEKYGIRLGITSFFVKAAILALHDHPRLNAEIQGDEMIIKHYYDIGIAIGDEDGLVVPVLRDADRMTFVEIERAIQKYTQAARDRKLSLSDILGGTFTITNGGVFGSLLSTPILNGPEVGILGLHRIEDRPVVRDGQIAVRPMMYLALSYDHRIVDGREAVQFLVDVKEAIQDPEILLLGL